MTDHPIPAPPDATTPNRARLGIAYREVSGDAGPAQWNGYTIEDAWAVAAPHGLLVWDPALDTELWALYPWHAVQWIEYHLGAPASRERG